MSGSNSTVSKWSWGETHIDWKVIGPYTLPGYSHKNCAAAYQLDPTFGRIQTDTFVLLMGPIEAWKRGHSTRAYDYNIFWLPRCNQPGYVYGGKAEIGNREMIMRGPLPSHQLAAEFREDQAGLFSAVVAHEMGHMYGAYHASCINNNNRGSVAWCDTHVKNVSLACNTSGAVLTEYCAPQTIMGYTINRNQPLGHQMDGWAHRAYFVMSRITFGWADTLRYPVLVSKIDYDHATDRYMGCDPNCSFRLQRSDAASLDKNASVVIILQTTHSTSNGDRYFVFEHRLNNTYDIRSTTSMLLIHSTDLQRNIGRPPGVYGNKKQVQLYRNTKGAKDIMVRTYGPTFLTDCTPNTSSWDDSGCALGQSIELDTGHEDAPMKMRVHVHPALLESGKLLKVTLSQVVGRGQGLARRKRRAL